VRDNYALAGGEAVGLQNDGIAERIQRFQSTDARSDRLKSRSRNAMFRKEILGKDLAAFELRVMLRGPDDLASRCAEGVHHSGDQWSFRTHYRQVDILLLGELKKVAGSHALGDFCDAGISRSG
jgi:hypothetical protein